MHWPACLDSRLRRSDDLDSVPDGGHGIFGSTLVLKVYSPHDKEIKGIRNTFRSR